MPKILNEKTQEFSADMLALRNEPPFSLLADQETGRSRLQAHGQEP